MMSLGLAFACEARPHPSSFSAFGTDSAVSTSTSDNRDVETTADDLRRPEMALDAAAPDAREPVTLPPGAGVRDLAEEACPKRHCLINDRCFKQGTLNPLNECQWCSPAEARHQWTALEDGAYCDNGLWCTTSDRCKLGFCTGQKRCKDSEVCSEFDRACLPR